MIEADNIEELSTKKPIFAYCEQCGQPIYRATDDEYGDDYVPLSKDACLHYDCVFGWAKKMKREAP